MYEGQKSKGPKKCPIAHHNCGTGPSGSLSTKKCPNRTGNGNCSKFLSWLTKPTYLVSWKPYVNLLYNRGYCPLHHWLPWGAIYFTYSPSRRQCRFRWFMNWRCESHTEEVAHLTCLRAEKPRHVQVDDKPVHPPCLSLQQRWFGIVGQIHVL